MLKKKNRKLKAEVCIIGGGVIGLCSAYYLNKVGFNVTVIDQSDMKSGASYVNAGYITPSHIVPLSSPGMPMKGLKFMFNPESPFYLKPRFESDLIKWIWKFIRNSTKKHVERCAPVLKQFNEKSKELYQAFAEDEKLDFSFTESGLLMLCQTKKMFHDKKEAGEFARKQGLKVEFINHSEIEAFEPDITPNAIGAVYYTTDALIIPQNFMSQFKILVQKNGVKIISSTYVKEIHAQNGKPNSLTTEQGRHTFDKLLIAAGSWSSVILKKLGIKLLLQAGKGYSFEIDNPGIKYPAILCEANVAVTPMGDKLRFGGTMELAGINQSITKKRVTVIKNAAEKYYPGIKIDDAVIETSVSGLRPVSPDGMPYIGKLKQFDNVYLATGHAMMGMSLGPATGFLVSEIFQEKETFIDSSLFNPNRFD